jgi:phosphoribosylformylglycinamidine (FGAM) synthase-like amidotransferase family enzyme
MQDLKPYAQRVEMMRNAQKRYFQLISAAKKTKQPAAFAEALKHSKEIELVVDGETQTILTAAV